MARNLNVLVLVLLAASLLHSSAAQTRHVVGGAMGWTIPSGGAATYATWASNNTFTVGDTLVFNFANGQHDVAKVTKAAFDACNTGSTIFTVTSSPSSITLNETGEQYYICTFGTHCSLGLKLAINVSRASSSSPSPSPSSSPAPQPSSPVPAPAPERTITPSPSAVPEPASAPAPSRGPVVYTVGDAVGWTVPIGDPAAYQTWASGKTFKVGDMLVFNFPMNVHNVAEVTKENFDSCNATSPLAIYSKPPVRVTLNNSGENYFICAVAGHCPAGLKLAINVTGSSITTGSSSPPSTTTPSSPSSTGAVSPPPQNSDAPCFGAAGLSATLLSLMAAAFL